MPSPPPTPTSPHSPQATPVLGDHCERAEPAKRVVRYFINDGVRTNEVLLLQNEADSSSDLRTAERSGLECDGVLEHYPQHTQGDAHRAVILKQGHAVSHTTNDEPTRVVLFSDDNGQVVQSTGHTTPTMGPRSDLQQNRNDYSSMQHSRNDYSSVQHSSLRMERPPGGDDDSKFGRQGAFTRVEPESMAEQPTCKDDAALRCAHSPITDELGADSSKGSHDEANEVMTNHLETDPYCGEPPPPSKPIGHKQPNVMLHNGADTPRAMLHDGADTPRAMLHNGADTPRAMLHDGAGPPRAMPASDQAHSSSRHRPREQNGFIDPRAENNSKISADPAATQPPFDTVGQAHVWNSLTEQPSSTETVTSQNVATRKHLGMGPGGDVEACHDDPTSINVVSNEFAQHTGKQTDMSSATMQLPAHCCRKNEPYFLEPTFGEHSSDTGGESRGGPDAAGRLTACGSNTEPQHMQQQSQLQLEPSHRQQQSQLRLEPKAKTTEQNRPVKSSCHADLHQEARAAGDHFSRANTQPATHGTPVLDICGAHATDSAWEGGSGDGKSSSSVVPDQIACTARTARQKRSALTQPGVSEVSGSEYLSPQLAASAHGAASSAGWSDPWRNTSEVRASGVEERHMAAHASHVRSSTSEARKSASQGQSMAVPHSRSWSSTVREHGSAARGSTAPEHGSAARGSTAPEHGSAARGSTVPEHGSAARGSTVPDYGRNHWFDGPADHVPDWQRTDTAAVTRSGLPGPSERGGDMSGSTSAVHGSSPWGSTARVPHESDPWGTAPTAHGAAHWPSASSAHGPDPWGRTSQSGGNSGPWGGTPSAYCPTQWPNTSAASPWGSTSFAAQEPGAVQAPAQGPNTFPVHGSDPWGNTSFAATGAAGQGHVYAGTVSGHSAGWTSMGPQWGNSRTGFGPPGGPTMPGGNGTSGQGGSPPVPDADDLPPYDLKDHIIVCGAEESFVPFVSQLHMCEPQRLAVVVLHPRRPTAALKELSQLGKVYYVMGTPCAYDALQSARSVQARALVYLSTRQRPATPSTARLEDSDYGTTSRSAISTDAEALLTSYGVGEELLPDMVHAVVELGFTSSVRFLQPGLLNLQVSSQPVQQPFSAISRKKDKNAKKNPFASLPFPRFSPQEPLTYKAAPHLVTEDCNSHPLFDPIPTHRRPRRSWVLRKVQERSALAEGLSEWQANPYFCAGRVTVPALLDTFACQAFFKKGLLLDIMTELAGDGGMCLTSQFTPIKSRGCALKTIPLPPQLVGRTYKDLFSHMVTQESYIPLGLYRKKSENPAWRLNYVATNPPPDTRLDAYDMVYVLQPHS